MLYSGNLIMRVTQSQLLSITYLVICSPPCLAACRRKEEAHVLLGFAIQVYEEHLAHGRHFLHERIELEGSEDDAAQEEARGA